MDYKILIILLALLFLVILIYREITTLKCEVMDNIEELTLEMRQTNDYTVTKLQNNMIKCVGQVKEISSDNINQLRKITELNHQPVTKIANHFTETDASEIHTDINYLSEVRNDKDIFAHPKTRDGNYYMSEDTDKSSDSEGVSGSKKTASYEKDRSNNIVCDDNICYIVPDPDNHKNIEIPMYQSKVQVEPTEKSVIKVDTESEYDDENMDQDDLSKEEAIKQSFIEEEASDDHPGTSDNQPLAKQTPDLPINTKDDYHEIEVDIYNMLNGKDPYNQIPPNRLKDISEALDNNDIYVVTEDTSVADENKSKNVEPVVTDVNDNEDDDDDEVIDMTGSIKILLNEDQKQVADDNDNNDNNEDDNVDQDASEVEETTEKRSENASIGGGDEYIDESEDHDPKEADDENRSSESGEPDEHDESNEPDGSDESYGVDSNESAEEELIVIPNKTKKQVKRVQQPVKNLKVIVSNKTTSSESEDEVTKLLEDKSHYTEVTLGKKQADKQEDESDVSYTSKLEHLLDGELKEETEYNLNDLKKIAKSLSVPLSYSIGNKRKPYKKTELYERIQKHLTDHSDK